MTEEDKNNILNKTSNEIDNEILSDDKQNDSKSKDKLSLGYFLKPNIGRTVKKSLKNFDVDFLIFSQIKNNVSLFLSKEDKNPIKTESKNPKKRFNDGLNQFNISDSELTNKLKISNITFNLLMIIMSISLSVILFMYPYQNSFISQLIYIMPCLTLIVLISSLLLRWGFYNYCLRNKAFYKFKDWLKTPSEWLTSSKFKNTLNTFLIMGFLFGSAFTINQANAATTNTVSSLSASSSSSSTDCSNSTTGSYVTTTFTLPCDNDLYKNSLESIFPNVTPLGYPTIVSSNNDSINGASALATAFQAFLSILMSVSMALLSFHIISALISVSHEGTMLSNKWSYVWSPLRVFIGAGCLTPFIKGYCIAQVFVLYVALWGGSLANVMWSAYVDGLTSPSIGSAPMPNLQQPVQKITQSMACWATLVASDSGGKLTDIPKKVPQLTLMPNTESLISSAVSSGAKFLLTINAKDNSAYYQKFHKYSIKFGDICGGAEISIPDSSGTSGYGTYGDSIKSALNTYLKNLGTEMLDTAKKSVLENTSTTIDNPNNIELKDSDITGLGKSINESYTTLLKTWGAAIQTFTDNLNSSSDMQSSISSFKENAKKYGWASSGSYYMTLSRLQGLTNDIILLTQPEIVPSSETGKNSIIEINKLTTNNSGDWYKIALQQVSIGFGGKTIEGMEEASANIQSGTGAGAISGISVNTNTTFFTNPENAFASGVNAVASLSSNVLNGFFNLVGADASSNSNSKSEIGGGELQKMIEFGQNLIAISVLVGGALVGFTGVGAGVGAASSAIPGAALLKGITGTLGKIAGMAAGLLFMILGSMLIAGILHAYILPMMPYIHFMLFFMSMLIFVVEAMIAAPLWAFIHVKLNGQELIGGEQRAGYMIVFNLFLRAPLGMFGLFLSLAIFNAMIFFLKLTFYPAVSAGLQMGTSSNINTNMGFLGTLIMVIMMSYLHFIIAIRSFELISELPNRVGRWFGANPVEGEGRLGEALKGFMTGSVAGQMSRSASQAFEGAMRDKRQNRPNVSNKNPDAPNSGGISSGGAGESGGIGGGMSGGIGKGSGVGGLSSLSNTGAASGKSGPSSSGISGSSGKLNSSSGSSSGSGKSDTNKGTQKQDTNNSGQSSGKNNNSKSFGSAFSESFDNTIGKNNENKDGKNILENINSNVENNVDKTKNETNDE